MTTFNDLAATLDFGEFLNLQRDMMHPDKATYVKTLIGARAVERGEHGSQVGVVEWVPQQGGRYEDSGEIQTTWLTDPVAKIICRTAKDHPGRRAVIHHLNENKSEDQPSGFRRIIWITILEDGNRPNTRQESSNPGPSRKSPEPEPDGGSEALVEESWNTPPQSADGHDRTDTTIGERFEPGEGPRPGEESF